MANPTTYFGWVMPTSSSLVTNLPADFNTFGQGVDTSLQDLLGGTTGQVLSKTSATNMDFTWVTPTDQTPLTTKGDLFTFTTVDARLAVGANDLVLSAASGEATGLKYTGAWTSYTPTLTNLTLGNGTLDAKWRQIGKMVDVYFSFTLGSTSAVGSTPTFSLPVNSLLGSIAYNLYLQDAGVGTFIGFANLGATSVSFYSANSSTTYTTYGNVNATTPMTWTTNDFMRCLISYEVA